MEYLIGGVVIVAFLGFIYSRVKKAKERRANQAPSSGGGGSSKDSDARIHRR